MSDKKPIIVITGPTASGKTALSIQVAKAFQTEIISADSVQIYQQLDIGSAKPTKEEQDGVVHHLLDFLPPDASYSVAQYVKDAKACANALYAQGKIPVMIGGTGLYINSFLADIDFEENNVDYALREKWNTIAEQKGGEYLLSELEKVDAESAKLLHANDIKRIVRALEFYETTHQTKAEHDRLSKQKPSPYEAFVFIIDYDRKELYDRINRRVDLMFENGLIEEVSTLLKQGYQDRNCLSMQGIGYKETIDYLHGLCTLEETKEMIKKGSRRYAKRQLTWFRRDPSIIWIPSTMEARAEFVVKYVSKRLYNGISMC